MIADATATITSASAAVLTAIVALLLNHRAFGLLDKRIDEINTNLGRRIDEMNTNLGRRIDEMNTNLGRRIDDTNHRIDETNTNLGRRIDDTNRRIDRLDTRLEHIEADLKEFYKVQADHESRIQRLEEKR